MNEEGLLATQIYIENNEQFNYNQLAINHE